ncbi:MAG TPA: ribosome maturation factor RimM [Gammaproteobacteria bacterium]|jgi:16S rRNA processing protein RimM|nr:ribosome maturation factor RimM [Gammaproteobacteria bacterium]HIK76862.1 ribosome maturation factor RimM [Gammaproteobacteria bacterium]
MKSGKKILVGKISNPHGIKGWVKVISFTDPIENILSYKKWTLSDNEIEKTCQLEDSRIQGNKIVIKLEGVNDRDDADLLKNLQIKVNRFDLPKLDENSYYWGDLIDFNVIDTKGKHVGKVDSLFSTGSNDVLVIIDEAKERLLVPFIMEEVIKCVDLAKELISIDWPDYE